MSDTVERRIKLLGQLLAAKSRLKHSIKLTRNQSDSQAKLYESLFSPVTTRLDKTANFSESGLRQSFAEEPDIPEPSNLRIPVPRPSRVIRRRRLRPPKLIKKSGATIPRQSEFLHDSEDDPVDPLSLTNPLFSMGHAFPPGVEFGESTPTSYSLEPPTPQPRATSTLKPVDEEQTPRKIINESASGSASENTPPVHKLFSQAGGNASRYLRLLYGPPDLDKGNLIDRSQLSPRFDNGELMLGIHPLKITFKTVEAGDLAVPLSPGLADLLFLREPSSFNTTDLGNYEQLMRSTRAMYKRFTPLEGYYAQRNLPKFKSVIAHFQKPISRAHLKRPIIGRGTSRLYNIDRIIDPNKLCSLLRKHTPRDYIYRAIIERLRYLGYIY